MSSCCSFLYLGKIEIPGQHPAAAAAAARMDDHFVNKQKVESACLDLSLKMTLDDRLASGQMLLSPLPF